MQEIQVFSRGMILVFFEIVRIMKKTPKKKKQLEKFRYQENFDTPKPYYKERRLAFVETVSKSGFPKYFLRWS